MTQLGQFYATSHEGAQNVPGEASGKLYSRQKKGVN